jgi:hypothetical protein
MNASEEKSPSDARKLGTPERIILGFTLIGAIPAVAFGLRFAVLTLGDPDTIVDGSPSILDYVFWLSFGIGFFGTVGAVLGAIAGGLVWLVWFLLLSAWQRFAKRRVSA